MNPLTTLISFAMEMLDSRTILRDSGKNSLVLLDELGKGTEALSGAAIGSILPFLYSLHTILHHIFYTLET